ncbi:hypothetical protein KUL72_30460 [Bradyrhizobium arachidis]|uniref:hypothetical protein n=1 Tax=Bradyrhizobium arachidis TaxID=858423 RepID=UPI002161AA74|nr:hypothetical protein [Bradyrhizobium arachidis]UVO35687.1 hypothetical protein KUL72_30460 [Bradyrhizobium arachidis]
MQHQVGRSVLANISDPADASFTECCALMSPPASTSLFLMEEHNGLSGSIVERTGFKTSLGRGLETNRQILAEGSKKRRSEMWFRQ